MADRKPLVCINGTVQEIPSGDTISDSIAPGTGGADGVSVVTKTDVRGATAGSLPQNTRVGNVLTSDNPESFNDTSPGGISNWSVGQSILVKNEGTAANNGIYEVTTVGSGGASWVLTRRSDADASAEMTAGFLVNVTAGTYAGSIWMHTTAGSVTLNTTAITFGRVDGIDGTNGTNGADGDDGADGQGVPTGGTAGQVLTKDSGTDFDTSWQDASGGGDAILPPIQSNEWVLSYGMTNNSGLQSVPQNILVCNRIYLPAGSYDNLGCYVSSGGSASSVLRMGLYTVDTDGSLGTLVIDAGTTSAVSTGAKSISFSATTLGGWYYIVLVHNSTSSISLAACDSRAGGFQVGQSSIDTTSVAAYQATFTYAVLPSTPPAITPTLSLGTNLARLGVQKV